jgi:lipopolysaccharide export system protein LptC
MIKLNKHIFISMVTGLTVTMFFSCKNNFKEVQNIGALGNEPITIAENINTKYTDSGRLKSNLLSKKMLDFSNRDFGFFEFPEGIDFTIFDEDGKKSNVIADYAMIYDETDLIDLQGNVVLTTHNKDTLFADQLFYDQIREWMFTNQPVKFRTADRVINGVGFDSNKDFTNAQVLEINGVIFIDE